MIAIKNSMQQDGIRRSAALLSAVFSRIQTVIVPGVTTSEIDRVVEETIKAGGGVPAFLGYGGFPASVCASVNDQVIHGIPDNTPLTEGDIVGCDIGVILDGYYSDACKTFPIGTVSRDTETLLEVTRESLAAAIGVCGPGARV
ncbi:MAG: M24 family metallopeptidase, partial [Spirochaetaceae bacterium]|nr:M24 family metallopeptidase [Spirochaetaceae bacterium]